MFDNIWCSAGIPLVPFTFYFVCEWFVCDCLKSSKFIMFADSLSLFKVLLLRVPSMKMFLNVEKCHWISFHRIIWTIWKLNITLMMFLLCIDLAWTEHWSFMIHINGISLKGSRILTLVLVWGWVCYSLYIRHCYYSCIISSGESAEYYINLIDISESVDSKWTWLWRTMTTV